MTFRSDSTATGTTGSTGTSTVGSTQFASVDWSTRARIAVGAVRSWQRIRSVVVVVWRRITGTLTPIGWLAVGAVVVLFPLGLALGWIEAVIAAAVALVALVLALPFLLGGRAYAIDFELPVDRVVAGSQVIGTLAVTNRARYLELPGRIDVPIGRGLTEVWVPLLRGGHRHEEQVVIPTLRRGIINVGPVTTVRSDPIGVLKREVAWAEVHRLYVHPQTVSIPSTSAGFVHDLEGSPSGRVVDDDISFHAIREYAAGDGQRHIHWKSTAKTGKLMVRQFEQTLRSRIAVVLALGEGEYADEDEFELAVGAAGSLGVRAIRDGRDVAVVASEQILDVARDSVRAIRSLGVLSTNALLDDLCTVERTAYAMPIGDVCTLATRAMRDLSIVFVMCGSSIDARRIRQLALRFPRDVQLVAVVANPAAAPGYRRLGDVGVFTIAVLEDFRHLLAGARA